MSERVANFLSNWVDANIVNTSHEPDSDPSVMQSRYLTDAVAAGVSLDDVNDEWEPAAHQIEAALRARFGSA